MPAATQTGLGFVAFALVAAATTTSPPPQDVRDVERARPFVVSLANWSDLRLIELGTDWPTKIHAGAETPMFCRSVIRLIGVEFGTRCALDATTIADAPG